jgi:hypothetical protein
MNIPLEAPCDRLDQPREPGDVMADAAQRDLFEYFAPPLTETGAPPLAGDFSPAAAPDAVAAVEDEDVTCHNQTWHDQTWHDQILAWPDDIYDDEISHHEPESPDEIAAYDPGACATHPEVAALDEASKANLRRLETTLSWMQNEVEACRLPPATPLSPILGLPVVGRIIDRSTLDRTLHRAPPPPAWLREPPAEPGIAPPSRGRVFWPRAFKFAMACVIAAPLAYYFAVTTSPLHEPLVEIAGVASLVSPVVRPPEARLRVSGATPELASEGSALAPERIVETPALPKPVQVETAIRSSPELPVAEAPAIPAPAAPAQAAQTEASQAEAPRVEAARAQITGPSRDRGCRRQGAVRSTAGRSGFDPRDHDGRAAGRQASDRPGQAVLRRRRPHRRSDSFPARRQCRRCRRCGGDGLDLRSRRSRRPRCPRPCRRSRQGPRLV